MSNQPISHEDLEDFPYVFTLHEFTPVDSADYEENEFQNLKEVAGPFVDWLENNTNEGTEVIIHRNFNNYPPKGYIKAYFKDKKEAMVFRLKNPDLTYLENTSKEL